MQFVHTALTWGFLLALVPLLIHLINMMRHQRVKWAAMDFLLQSYKKHRKWVWLKQFLLLLLRMLAIAVVVAMLAQWKSRDQWLDLFGGKSTHHFVLLDDSYSMSERVGAVNASDVAKQVVGRIVARAAEPDNVAQKITVLRFSKAARASIHEPTSTTPTAPTAADAAKNVDASKKISQVADFNAEIIDTNFATQLEDKRQIFEVTQLSTGPVDALVLIKQLLEKGSKDQNVVYVVSDYRANQWENPGELKESLRDLEKVGAEIQLIDCTKTAQPNLAITDIKPTEDTRAAGVPLYVTIDVKNYSTAAVKNVQLKVRTIYYPPDLVASVGDIDNAMGTVEELPTVLLEEIKPGETLQTRVQVYFPKPGQHAVEAILPDDAVTTDNRRWCVVDFQEGEPVLLIDGGTNAVADVTPGYFLTSVFQPGGRINTGIRPVTHLPAFLRDSTPRELSAFRAIYLLDIFRLEPRAVENLEAYVKAGGGLAIFVSDTTSTTIKSYSETLYRNGEGLLPLPLEAIELLPPQDGDRVADIEVSDHPIFKEIHGETNSDIRWVTIDKFVRPPADWIAPNDSTVRVIASLRNKSPLMVERQFGQGRVVVVLTTLAPQWNNWAKGFPSFVITQLKLESYLAATQRATESHLVGAPLKTNLEADKFRPEVTFVVPGAKSSSRVIVARTAVRPKENSPFLQTALGQSGESGDDDTFRSGVYEAWTTNLNGNLNVHRYALNVEPTEGDLAVVDSTKLLEKLAPVKVKFNDADAFDSELAEKSGFNRSLFLMALLLLLLAGEQFLAYTASYHPPRTKLFAAPGVAR